VELRHEPQNLSARARARVGRRRVLAVEGRQIGGQRAGVVVAGDAVVHRPSAFEREVDVILTPTAPTVAFRIGEKTGDPLSMYLSDIFTITLNLAGLPGISIPCGKNSENLPIGMQLMANHFEEALLLNVAHHFEKAGGFAV